MSYSNNLVITIMAAGEGKRMNSVIPKVLHKFAEKPILLHIIETARELNPRQIIVITGNKSHATIVECIREFTHIDDIIFVTQDVQLGTGDAIKSCLPEYKESDMVLILNGDMPLVTKDILSGFLSDKSRILAANFAIPTGYGRMVIGNNNHLLRIIEEKDCSIEERGIQIVNSGIYLFSSYILRKYIPKIGNNNAQKEYYLTDIVQIINDDFVDLSHSIDVYYIDESLNRYIKGVNTQLELMELTDYNKYCIV